MATTLFRFFHRDAVKTATVRHIPTSTPPNDYPGSDEETMLGALVQLSRYQRALMGGDMRTKYLFFVDDDANIREADKVTIDGTTYLVSNVDLYDYGTVKHRAATLTKP